MNFDALTSNPLLIGLIALSIVTLVLAAIVISMWLKLRKFLIGIDSKNIADSLNSVSGDLSDLKSFRGDVEGYLRGVEKRLRKSVRSVQTVRFNPWHGSGDGGNQSFATAFMNEEGDGVVISSLYSRERVSVFGKALKKHGSEHELSTEEAKAVEEAKNSLV